MIGSNKKPAPLLSRNNRVTSSSASRPYGNRGLGQSAKRRRLPRAEEDASKEKSRPKKINRHVGEDPAKLIAELSPGKKGGCFQLPFGGDVTIPPGALGKKDVVTCSSVSPSDRFKYQPPIKSDEYLVSEIFQLAVNAKLLKKTQPLCLRLPFYKDNHELNTLCLLVKRTDDEDWSVCEDAVFENEERLVKFEASSGGIFVVTSSTRQERFEIPVQGCLYNAKLHHQISLRFPKKATDTDITCQLSITPLNRTLLSKLRNEFQSDLDNLLEASDFYDIRPSTQKAFRRSVTVKLPLPPTDRDEIPVEDLAILQMTSEGWQVHDVVIKVIKNSVSFDTRTLAKYCVTLANPQRKMRLPEAFKHIERENLLIRGDIQPFLHIQDKLWTFWFDVAPVGRIGQNLDRRLQQGFRRVKKTQLPFLEQPAEEAQPRRGYKSGRMRAAPQPAAEPAPYREELDLHSGEQFEVEIAGDMTLSEEEDSGSSCLLLTYHDRLPDNYRRFFIEPRRIEGLEGRILTGFVKCYSNVNGERKCLRTFDFDVSPENVSAFWYVEPEPEPEVEAPEVVEPEVERPETPPAPPPPSSPPSKSVPPRPSTASFARLTKPAKPPKKLCRDPKVLTGRSLMTLAREVEQGLTLAIHLEISDSTITGMGFDALANGLSLVDITYKILLLWKRRTSRLKERQVDMLIGAMKEMGRPDLADVIADRHRENQEITPECFGAVAAE